MSDLLKSYIASMLYVWEYNDAVERFKLWRLFDGLTWDGPTDEKITIRRPTRG